MCAETQIPLFSLAKPGLCVLLAKQENTGAPSALHTPHLAMCAQTALTKVAISENFPSEILSHVGKI